MANKLNDKMNYSQEFMQQFIDIYREHECLWKVSYKYYMNKDKKKIAYEKLTAKLSEVDSYPNIQKVRRIINSMRTNYRHKWKKLQNSIKSNDGEIYKPSVWYFDALKFITDQDTPNYSTQSNDSTQSNSVDSYIDIEEALNITIKEEKIDETFEETSSHNYSDIDGLDQSMHQTAKKQLPTLVRRNPVRNRKRKPSPDRKSQITKINSLNDENQDAGVTTTDENVTSITEIPTGQKNYDEFSIYGEHIANELRQFKDPKFGLILADIKKHFAEVLYEAAIKRFKVK